jgi:hypothetical protein
MVSTRSSKKPTPHEKKIKLVEQLVISSSSDSEEDEDRFRNKKLGPKKKKSVKK